jgi:uncharacterized protein (UPF0248 family)
VQTLRQLLDRIRWDPEFGKGRFALGYHDRVAGELRIVPFASIAFDVDRPGFFALEDDDGVQRHIPLHRVRVVYKNGAVIWQRPGGVPEDEPRE